MLSRCGYQTSGIQIFVEFKGYLHYFEEIKNHRKMGNYTSNSLLKVASEIPFMYQVEDGMLNIFEISTFFLFYFQSNNEMVDGTWPAYCHCICR